MSLIKTRMQDLRVDYPSQFDRDELRETDTGLLTAVLNMTTAPNSIISSDLRTKAEKSVARKLDIPVMKKGIVTISNVRSCVIAGGQSESDMYTVVWKTIAADIFMIPAYYHNNEIGYNTDMSRKLEELTEAFKIEIEEDLDTAINANKTQVYRSSIPTTDYTIVGGAIQVPKSEQDFIFNNLDAINFADDFRAARIKVIASHAAMPIVRKYINQGSGNAVNTAFQFGNLDFTFSNRVTNAAGKIATAYFMPDGTVGLLTRTDLDSQASSRATDGTQWDEENLSGLPFPVGIQYKSKCSDQSLIEAGMGHLVGTLVENWQISVDYAILTPYNSDPATKPGAIRKIEFVPNPNV